MAVGASVGAWLGAGVGNAVGAPVRENVGGRVGEETGGAGVGASGQARVLQDCVDVTLGQATPLRTAGLIIDLVRRLEPPPQRALQLE